ncbi:MAG: hypothetical protein QXO15_06960 [Nitrososphaerota archaeon]
MVLLRFNFEDGSAVKHSVRILLSKTCRVEGVSLPVPTRFATRYLLLGLEEAWRLLEEVDRALSLPAAKNGSLRLQPRRSLDET